MKKYIYFFFALALFTACEKESTTTNNNNGGNAQSCPDNSLVDEKIWKEGTKTMLYGGEVDSMHFNISNWTLNKCNLRYGIGRERFQALLDPVYTPIAQISNIKDDEKCIVLRNGNELKVYPYVTMSYHEVINEKYNGHPIAVAYCVLADLAVVYDTQICGKDLTFAVSGYTYAQEGVFDNIEAFILWDRETESLWWPLIDMGVSGPYSEVEIKKYDESTWETKLWKDIIDEYPNAKVLDIQEQDIPNKNFKIDPITIDC